MSKATENDAVNVYSQACVYHIILKAKITPTLLDYLDDLQVREGRDGKINVIGWLPDQSALIGLLYNLHGTRCSILSVKALINDENEMKGV